MKKVSRRTFARDAVVIAGAAAVMPELLAEPTPSQPPAIPEVEARVQWIFAKYGPRLDSAQRADIRRLIAGGQSSIDAMRAYPLDNSVSPATPFQPEARK